MPDAPDGEYYYFELIGCTCEDRHEGELGRVDAIVEDGGGLLLQVVADDRTLLVPFVREYLVSVDVEAQRIELELPEGLVDLCASTS